MRFITEFETDDSNYVKGIKKIHGEENIGHEIARSFGWNERGVTKLDPAVRVIHIHKLEIEAFPMDKWIEFKQKLFTHVYEEGRQGVALNQVRILELIKELESYGKPAKETKQVERR